MAAAPRFFISASFCICAWCSSCDMPGGIAGCWARAGLYAMINRPNASESSSEIAGFLRTRDAGGAPCRTVRAAAERVLTAIDQQIADLGARRDEMRRTLDIWDETLRTTPAGQPARLLERR